MPESIHLEPVPGGVNANVSTIHQMNMQIASATEAQNRMVSQSIVQVREAALQVQERQAGQLREALRHFKPN
ncbi:hypothetical protein OH710_07490 [Pseudomonas capsici]|uniref:hypothetical protein n=1 Tax=Pseudomonas capsici TaxID=2810614 RepID=UPI0021F1174C|nr:hypothetical protein [Pseudomonas capsici]MCV4272481.1 hypothetical protein [Pseudomonas capsici]